MNENDLKIIEDIKMGALRRRSAEAKLFQEYQYFATQASSKHKLNEEESQSAYCDAFMALVQQIINGRFQGKSAIKTFFYSIFSKKCIDAVRKKTTNKSGVHNTEWVEDWPNLSNRTTCVLKSIIQKEMVEEVQESIKKIGEKCRSILSIWGRGYSAQEIANILGYKSAQTVRTSKSRCMEKLIKKAT